MQPADGKGEADGADSNVRFKLRPKTSCFTGKSSLILDQNGTKKKELKLLNSRNYFLNSLEKVNLFKTVIGLNPM